MSTVRAQIPASHANTVSEMPEYLSVTVLFETRFRSFDDLKIKAAL